MTLHGMNWTGQDAHEEAQRAAGLGEPSADEELARRWELADVVAERGSVLG